jgi:predicted enzyme related to lactoylglutathione lyase
MALEQLRGELMITKVAKVGVYVKDQERALKFFTEVLGFELVANLPMGESARWIEVSPKGAETKLALWTPPGLEDRIGTFSGIVFEADDIEKTHRNLVEKGVRFTQAPVRQGGGVMGQFTDPDGNTFVLRGPDAD